MSCTGCLNNPCKIRLKKVLPQLDAFRTLEWGRIKSELSMFNALLAA